MSNSLTDTQLKAWKSLLNVHAHVVGAIESRLSERGQIPLTWYDVLWSLKKGDCGCRRFRELQDEVVLSRSALSRSLDALARAKLIKKQPCKHDKRGIDVTLTDAGHRALADAWPVYSEGIRDLFAAALSADDCRQLTAILGKIGAAFVQR